MNRLGEALVLVTSLRPSLLGKASVGGLWHVNSLDILLLLISLLLMLRGRRHSCVTMLNLLHHLLLYARHMNMLDRCGLICNGRRVIRMMPRILNLGRW